MPTAKPLGATPVIRPEWRDRAQKVKQVIRERSIGVLDMRLSFPESSRRRDEILEDEIALALQQAADDQRERDVKIAETLYDDFQDVPDVREQRSVTGRNIAAAIQGEK